MAEVTAETDAPDTPVTPEKEVPNPLIRWAPQHSPITWLTINALIFGYSIFMLLAILLAQSEGTAGVFARHSFLVYDFITTFIWCIEVGLNEWVSRTGDRRNVVWLRVELAIAIFFCIWTMFALYKWHAGNEETLASLLVEVSINFVVYGWMTIQTVLILCQNQKETNQQTASMSLPLHTMT